MAVTVHDDETAPTQRPAWRRSGARVTHGLRMARDTIIELLGLSSDELQVVREEGQTLKNIAAEQGPGKKAPKDAPSSA
jgi:hypothetical protein